ncbi:hypothetical protein N7490_007667 [Penicillium lividum]|nr:hypothetical protein N7490_007667 [Penicillium lividum]
MIDNVVCESKTDVHGFRSDSEAAGRLDDLDQPSVSVNNGNLDLMRLFARLALVYLSGLGKIVGGVQDKNPTSPVDRLEW